MGKFAKGGALSDYSDIAEQLKIQYLVGLNGGGEVGGCEFSLNFGILT